MQRKEFENRIKSLLPKAADDVVESWAEYATELDQDGTEAAADFYDKNYMFPFLVAFLKSVVMQPSMRKCITDFRIR